MLNHGVLLMTRKTISDKEKIEICKDIFNLMSDGLSLRKSAISLGYDNKTIREWIAQFDLSPQYDLARSELHDFWADEILTISDDSSNDYIETETGQRPNTELVARSRLRVDSRKWLLSKLASKKYGDKLELSGNAENPIHITATELTDDQLAQIAAGKIDKR